VALEPGDTFDRYRIEQLLGAGGWGQVYRAVDTRLRRKVALKVLKKERAAEAPRFLREARAAAALDHPNVVAVYDLGEVDGVPYIAMELAEGKLLSELAGPKSGKTVREKLGWLIDVAHGLHASHQAGLLHRDVKPQNVIVTKGGVVKVLDFGLAKPTEEHEVLGPATQPAFQTRAGHVVGTPRYMAPEALRGSPCDGRADQFSWGVTAYEVLGGVHPRGGKADAVALDTPRLLSEFVPDVPFALAAAVSRTISGERSNRFADMGALIAALEDVFRPDEQMPATRDAPPTADVAPVTRMEGPPATVRDPSFSDITDPSKPPVMTVRPDQVDLGSGGARLAGAAIDFTEKTKPAAQSPMRKSSRALLNSTALSPTSAPMGPAQGSSATRSSPMRSAAPAPTGVAPRTNRALLLVLGLVAVVGIGLGLAAAFFFRGESAVDEVPSAKPAPSTRVAPRR
jgi:serine/threonine protein kinase